MNSTTIMSTFTSDDSNISDIMQQQSATLTMIIALLLVLKLNNTKS